MSSHDIIGVKTRPEMESNIGMNEDEKMGTQATSTHLHEELQQLRVQVTALQEEMACQQALARAAYAREDRYRKLIEASNDAILVIDPKRDQILEANPTACRMLGYTQAELLALSVSAIHPHEIAQMTQFVQAVVRQGKGWTNELSCRTKVGAFVPAEISASIVEMEERSCLLALLRDTTERKRAEARIRQEAARADALTRVAARLNAQLDLDTVLQAICEETTKALGVPAAVLLFFDEKQGVFYPAATYGLPPAFTQQYIPNPRSVYDQYPQQGTQIVVPNLRALPNLVNGQLFEDYGIHAIAIAGLNREDHLLGALSAYALDPSHTFREDDITLLRSLADLAAQAVRNAILYQAEQRRSAQFKTLSEVGRHITSILAVDELLRQIAHAVQRIFSPAHVRILLLEEEALVLVEPPPRQRVSCEQGIIGWVARQGAPALIGDVTQDERCLIDDKRFTDNKVSIRSELAVPMKVQQRVIGVVDVASDTVHAYDEMDLIVLQSFADQATVALENARLYAQTRQLAVLEERQRLARELHDSVTQALYGMTLYTAAASDLLAAGDSGTADSHLRIMQETAQLALSEMRLLIFQLRSPTLRDGLAAALQERLEAVEQRSGIKTTFTSNGSGCVDARVDEELYRIAQEALNNVLKHARAQTVTVHLHQEKGYTCLQICDDGIGFASQSAKPSGGLGLRGIAERVAQLGGALAITSHPGQGTTIQVEVRSHE